MGAVAKATNHCALLHVSPASLFRRTGSVASPYSCMNPIEGRICTVLFFLLNVRATRDRICRPDRKDRKPVEQPQVGGG